MRALAISLLSDENGISENSWSMLSPLLEANDHDIIDAIEATEERFYLPKDFAGIVPKDCPF